MKKITLLILFTCSIIFGQTAYAQVRLVVSSVTSTGGCKAHEIIAQQIVENAQKHINSLPDCENAKSSFCGTQNYSFYSDYFKLYFECTVFVTCHCVGSPINGQNSIPQYGNINFNGIYQGEPVISMPYSREQDWATDFQVRNEALLGGDELQNKAKENLGWLDINTVIPRNEPSMPKSNSDINRSMKINQYLSQRANAIKELAKYDRLCDEKPKPPINCSDYEQNRKAADSIKKAAKDELFKLKSAEKQDEINLYAERLEEYKQYLQTCQMETDCNRFRREIQELEQKISDLQYEKQNIMKELNRQEKRMEQAEEQMSWTDRTEENANERLRKNDELQAELSEKYNRKEISSLDYSMELIKLSDLRADANAELNRVATVRTANDAYEWGKETVKETKETLSTMGDMLTGKYNDDKEVRKNQIHFISSGYELASEFLPPGSSQFVGALGVAGHDYADYGTVNSKNIFTETIKGSSLGAAEFATRNTLNANAVAGSEIFGQATKAKNITSGVVDMGKYGKSWFNATKDAKHKERIKQ